MLQSLRAGETFRGVYDQQLLDEVLALIRYVVELFVFEVEFALFYLLKDNLRILPLEWQVARHQGVQKHSYRPQISLHIVTTGQHFWRHVVRGACYLLGLLLPGLLRESEVYDSDYVLVVDHDVLGLYVPVHDAHAVAVVDRAQDLLHVV